MANITTMSPSDSHFGTIEVDDADVVEVLEQELDADPGDDDERAVDERRVARDQRQ